MVRVTTNPQGHCVALVDTLSRDTRDYFDLLQIAINGAELLAIRDLRRVRQAKRSIQLAEEHVSTNESRILRKYINLFHSHE